MLTLINRPYDIRHPPNDWYILYKWAKSVVKEDIFRRDSGEELRKNFVTTKKSYLLSRNNFVGSRFSDENFTDLDYQFSEFNRSSWIEDEFLKLGL